VCGIAGIWNRDGTPVSHDHLTLCGDALAHRGPDASGVWQSGPLGFVHRRLRILDLSTAADQPFYDGESVLVFNGEIFNFQELRSELQRLHPFRTTSDTEVLFRALQTWGSEALNRIAGQFAFAFFDIRTQSLLLARDHVGICPLYVHETPERFIFASEIRPILRLVAALPDPQGIMEYFTYRYTIQSGRTLFKNIRRCDPGTLTEIDLRSRRIRTRRYWRLRFSPENRSDEQAEFTALLDTEIRRQMQADVPLGMYLSGGIDSRAILTGLQTATTDCRTFSITFGPGDTDWAEIERLNSRKPFTKRLFPFGLNQLTDIEQILGKLEEPFGDLLVCINHFLAAQASREVRVVLSGEGGDEAFGGYDHQRLFMRLAKAARLGNLLDSGAFLVSSLPAAFFSLANSYPGAFGEQEKQRISRVMSLMKDPLQAYHSLVRLFDSDELSAMLSPNLLASCPPPQDIDHSFVESFTHDRHLWQSVLRIEIEQLTLIVNLLKQDRFSMAFGLESRVPLVSRTLLDFMGTLPFASIFRGRNKCLLANYGNAPASLKKKAFSVLSSPEAGTMIHGLQRQWLEPRKMAEMRIFSERFLRERTWEQWGHGFLGEKKRMALMVFLIWHSAFAERFSAAKQAW
jgi:asparagine synthase (glutamine-hydrolysing)